MIASAIRLIPRQALLLVLGMMVTPLTLAACSDITELRVVSQKGQPLVRLPMPQGAGWCMAWNHSVEGFTVHDCYRNVAGKMVLERSHLPDFAAGLDHIPGRGRQTSDGQGGYWIEDIDEPVLHNHYRLRVGAMRVDHRLVSHGKPSLGELIADANRRNDDQCSDRYPPPSEAPVAIKSEAPVAINSEEPVAISLSELAANQAVTVGLYSPPSSHTTAANSESSL